MPGTVAQKCAGDHVNDRMIRRTWPSGMIARSQAAKAAMQRFGAASALASRFVAGANAEASIDRARALHDGHAIRSSLFYLGEYVDRAELVAENIAIVRRIGENPGNATLLLRSLVGSNARPEARKS